MLTMNQIENIHKYVDPYYFDVKKLEDYLTIHSTVGAEVFHAVLRRTPRMGSITRQRRYANFFEDGFGFSPISTEVFIRRIPLYFYVANPEENGFGDLASLIDAYSDYQMYLASKNEGVHSRSMLENINWEPLYEKLEHMLYDFKLEVKDIMTYISSQSSNSRRYDLFEKWYEYLDLAFENRVQVEVKPSNILYAHNVLLESLGKEPILYYPSLIGYNERFIREGKEIRISGEFPVNPETKEVEMRWVLVWAENHGGIETKIGGMRSRYDSSLEATLVIKLDRKTRIYLPAEDAEYVWEPIYSGPQAMVYDNTAIKRLREEAQMTQKDVADMIGVGLRTYQNWDAGLSKPDTLDLIKLMNLFDIYSVQELIKNNEIEDPGFEKFRTGCGISFFVPIE